MPANMEAQVILWVYILLLVAGGVVGWLKSGSKISFIMAAAFAVPLVLCALSVLPFGAANWLLLALVLVFVWRLVKTRKFMPAGLMLALSIAALAGLVLARHA